MSAVPFMKGIAIGVTVGAMTYAISNSSTKSRKRMKRNSGKAVRAMGDVIDGISMMLH